MSTFDDHIPLDLNPLEHRPMKRVLRIPLTDNRLAEIESDPDHEQVGVTISIGQAVMIVVVTADEADTLADALREVAEAARQRGET